MPEIFKKDYPNTRIIIDATELVIERPSSLSHQSATFSNYKNKNTVKVLVGITPSGVISFVSQTYEGSISDRKLVVESKNFTSYRKSFQVQYGILLMKLFLCAVC